MAIILSIESSTTICSVAIHDHGKLVVSSEMYAPQSASSQLAVMIEKLFADISIPKNRLQAVAVTEGPGSYTGLRIGIALAKGLCFSLNIPLISINTLLLMSSQVRSSGCKEFLCPMLDARRMEVYCLLLNKEDTLVKETAAIIIDELSFRQELEENIIYFFGDGAAKCQPTITHPNGVFLKGVVPLASAMGELAFNKFQHLQFEDLVTFEPLYLKEFLVKKPKAKI